MYLIYDIESVVDGELLRDVRYPGENVDDAIRNEKEAQLKKTDGASDFIPVGFHIPVAITVAKVGPAFDLETVVALDAPRHDPRRMVEMFWGGVSAYKGSTLVDFNGRGFDLPLLTACAFRWGITCRRYFNGPKFGLRYRYGEEHLDLMDWLTDFGAWRMKGGLDYLSKALGRKGKTTKGGDVAELHAAGRLEEISAYCTRDVLDTYAVFLRTRVMRGELDRTREAYLIKALDNRIESGTAPDEAPPGGRPGTDIAG